MEILKRNSNKLLDRQATQTLLDNLKEDHAAVVDELVPNLLSIGAVQNVLRNLLKENIPIRDLVTILETLADRGNLIRDPEILTEHVRIALAETITTLNKNEQGEIVAMTLDARFEEYIMGQMTEGRHPGPNLGLSPRQMNHVYEQVTQKMQELLSTGDKPIMVTGPSIRRFVKRFFEPAIPQLSILSISELLPHITINTIGSIGLQSYD
jgi:flagellar biosynthesis protein FlhA